MEVVKFNCLKCGKCCRESKAQEKNSTESYKIVLNPPTLILQDWEVDSIRYELSKINSDRKILPHTAFYNTLLKETIIDTYTLDSGKCPFLKENKCIIYEKRPSICRRFPFLFNIIDILFGKDKKIYMPRNVHCEFERNDHFLDKVQGKRLEILKMLEERYGDIYFYQIGYILFQNELDKFIKGLEKAGGIRFGKIIEESKELNISTIYKQYTGKDFKDFFNINKIKGYIKDKTFRDYFKIANGVI